MFLSLDALNSLLKTYLFVQHMHS